MDKKVFKFGGASVRDAAHIYNVKSIIDRYEDSKLLLVISAMGKSTNALEKVYRSYLDSGVEGFNETIAPIVEEHLNEVEKLNGNKEEVEKKMESLIKNSVSIIQAQAELDKPFLYDQIVSLGELFSTVVVEDYLKKSGLKTKWLDVREIVITDDTHRESIVDFVLTQENSNKKILPLFEHFDIVVTQGFLGGTQEGVTTTLGREGSDYSAAIFAYTLDVKEVTIWKDVPGILTADPRRFENVQKIDRMSYKEAIEMTYYGAKVIHPKTISPIQNKGIRLNVKSFIDPEGEGTVIAQDGLLNYPPIVVVQDDVILIQIFTKDFSFFAENHLSMIFSKMNENRIKLCMMKNSAVSFSICISNPGIERLNAFLEDIGDRFTIDVFKNLQLMTVRYFNDQLISNLLKNKVVLFEERMKYTIQLAVRQSLELIEKKE